MEKIICLFNTDMLTAVGTNIIGIGTFLMGIAALLALKLEFGARIRSKYLETSLRLLLRSYREYMSSEEGIVWSDYPSNADKIISGVERKTGLEKELIKELLDGLKAEGRI